MIGSRAELVVSPVASQRLNPNPQTRTSSLNHSDFTTLRSSPRLRRKGEEEGWGVGNGWGRGALRQRTDPRAVVGLGLQIRHLGDLLEEVGLLHPADAAVELSPRVGEDHLEVDAETCKEEEKDEGSQ